MFYKVTHTKVESIQQLRELVNAFEKEYAVLKRPDQKEMQLRNDYINPLLKTFGWDVDNEGRLSQFLRDVVLEETVDVEEEDEISKKNPDYTLRVRGTRRLFIEAKKASVDLLHSSKAAFQLRRYGWSAKLGISILTNFEYLVLYDCRHKPGAEDDPTNARYQIFHYQEFVDKFDDLHALLSCESVASGYVDEYFSTTQPNTSTFDDYFLEQIERWREWLAAEIVRQHSQLTEGDINTLVQRLLNRIVFLRICEDREIEDFETLKNIKTYEDLKRLFQQADKKYNSGLFKFIEDQSALKTTLRPEILSRIFSELYYPQSPYDFSVVDPAILSQIYERYLGSRVTISGIRKVSIVDEPEVREAHGVIPTPKSIVENIVAETLRPILEGKSSDEIAQLKIADICCGSGTFLLSVFELLIEKMTLTYQSEELHDTEFLHPPIKGVSWLTLKAKQSILLNNIFGVDINPYAAEVTKFSLLLKLLENENAASVNAFLNTFNQGVLPDLEENVKTGNSLVDSAFFKLYPAAINDNDTWYKIKPFTWVKEFPFLNATGGFDAIVGNPPFIRIQKMVKYQPKEITFYQNNISRYTVAKSKNIDKYFLFIQRALELLNRNGVLGYIVPHKFFVLTSGMELRKYISSNAYLRKIVHFGVTQVFPNRSTYTAILILDIPKRKQFQVARVQRISPEFTTASLRYTSYDNSDFKEDRWTFLSKETQAVFNKMKAAGTIPLAAVAEIPVGLQTSNDDVYIFRQYEETEKTFRFRDKYSQYEIEKAICKPMLKNVPIELFGSVTANAQIIFPYTVEDNNATLFSEEIFIRDFPLAWAYLNKFKEELSNRKIKWSKGSKWYQFGRTQSIADFHNVPKLIWHVLSMKAGYIYDTENIQVTGGGNGPYYALYSSSQYSTLYLMGILSHPLIESMIKAVGSVFRGDYYSHGKQFVAQLPIKTIDFNDQFQREQHDKIVGLVEQLMATKKEQGVQYSTDRKKVLENKLDYLRSILFATVSELYGVTDKDIDTVLNDDAF